MYRSAGRGLAGALPYTASILAGEPTGIWIGMRPMVDLLRSIDQTWWQWLNRLEPEML
jgi:hypothetical protein